jgi:hypothetical protein
MPGRYFLTIQIAVTVSVRIIEVASPHCLLTIREPITIVIGRR